MIDGNRVEPRAPGSRIRIDHPHINFAPSVIRESSGGDDVGGTAILNNNWRREHAPRIPPIRRVFECKVIALIVRRCICFDKEAHCVSAAHVVETPAVVEETVAPRRTSTRPNLCEGLCAVITGNCPSVIAAHGTGDCPIRIGGRKFKWRRGICRCCDVPRDGLTPAGESADTVGVGSAAIEAGITEGGGIRCE